jgi:hypothetical protein
MKRITLYEFKRLPEQEQFNLTFHIGIFLEHYFTEHSTFSLYAIDRFFAETEYNSDKNELVGIKAFKTGTELFKYSSFKETGL